MDWLRRNVFLAATIVVVWAQQGSILSGSAAALPADGAASNVAGHEPGNSSRHPFIESGFPFFTATIDFRDTASLGLPENNLVVRGVVLKLDHHVYACFDTDLLRMAAVWRGESLDLRGIAPLSYAQFNRKQGGGEKALSRLSSPPLLATGLYPGWRTSERDASDPRPPGPDPGQIGRGPIPPQIGRWHGLYVHGNRTVLAYSAASTSILESTRTDVDDGHVRLVRTLELGPSDKPLFLAIAEFPPASRVEPVSSDGWLTVTRPDAAPAGAPGFRTTQLEPDSLFLSGDGRLTLRLPPAPEARIIELECRFPIQGDEEDASPADRDNDTDSGSHLTPVPRDSTSNLERPSKWTGGGPGHWVHPVLTHGRVSESFENGLAVDEIGLPVNNPWGRKVRPSGIDFFKDGRGAVVTIDGDVWFVSNISPGLDHLHWRRFASGLHEPESIVVRNRAVYVFTRNGIIQLHDLNGDGEADFYENFSNAFAQAPETREFPMDMVSKKDGGFYIAKGGQQIDHLGIHAGTVLEIAPDGSLTGVVGSGFRQPYLGYDSGRDLLTASDQQGHYVPSTPIHHVRNGGDYGFRARSAGNTAFEGITEPLCWIPHRVVQSAAAQLWVPGSLIGGDALDSAARLLCFDYYNPGAVMVYLDDPDAPIQAAAVRLPVSFETPVLKASVRASDRHLYTAGFQIWGSIATEPAGISRLRFDPDQLLIPLDVRAVEQGVLLKFKEPISKESLANTGNFHVRAWNYKRSPNYGSGHYQTDGAPGEETWAIGKVAATSDRKTLLLHLIPFKPVMQLSVGYKLKTDSQIALNATIYLTTHRLPGFDDSSLETFPTIPTNAGIPTSNPDPDLESLIQDPNTPPSVDRGHGLYLAMGCVGCHSLDGSTEGRTGPSLKGTFHSLRTFQDGTSRIADEEYMRESILDPQRRLVVGFDPNEVGMPSYRGILSENQIESIIQFLESLNAEKIPR